LELAAHVADDPGHARRQWPGIVGARGIGLPRLTFPAMEFSSYDHIPPEGW